MWVVSGLWHVLDAVCGWFEGWQVVEGAPPGVCVICYALHAARDLDPHEEITFHYEAEYACVRRRKQ